MVEPETCRLGGGGALHEDVDTAHELLQRRLAVGGGEVERDAALAAVEEVVCGVVGVRALTRQVDLDHLGAVVGEDHRGHRAGDPPAEIEHAQAGTRRSHR